MHKELARLRAQAEAEFAQAQADFADAKARYAEEVKAIEIVEAKIAPKKQPRKRVVSHVFTRENTNPRYAALLPPSHFPIGLDQATIDALIGKKDGATLKEIRNYVGHNYPGMVTKPKQVARMLYKLKKKGSVRLIRKQSGIVPGLYALKEKGTE